MNLTQHQQDGENENEIPTIEIADSKFLGFAQVIDTPSEAFRFQKSLKKKYPTAAHIPFCWVFSPTAKVQVQDAVRVKGDAEAEAEEQSKARNTCTSTNTNTDTNTDTNTNTNYKTKAYQLEYRGFDEDNEPFNSCGKFLFKESKLYFDKYMCNESSIGMGMDKNMNMNIGMDTTMDTDIDAGTNIRTSTSASSPNDGKGIVLAIVRFFGKRLLGVTCGRLSHCYQSISILTLHRFFHGRDVGLHQDFTNENITQSKYGMGAGDCELILNIVSNIHGSDDQTSFLKKIYHELDYTGFKGNQGETLPRLQNLQADTSNGTIPVYRYPGNYRGDEWNTYEWSPTSLQVKDAVETHLKPLHQQEMNHCVSNFYRDGKDFIDHHSDKDLDLDKDAVIVSVSLGDERILELKRRSMPRDTIQIRLPHGSMLVLGPKTNQQFTHSILKKEGSDIPRMSLTFRHVVTFMDLNTGRLFGEGVKSLTLKQARNAQRIENALFFASFTGIIFLLNQRNYQRGENSYNYRSYYAMNKEMMNTYFSTAGLFAFSFFPFRSLSLRICKNKEEQEARQFFSKASIHGTKY